MLNAVHVLPNGGHVRIETGSDDNGIHITIADSGPGVPVEIRESIFEPFFSTKKEGVGTGLGLYICRNILEEHGGTIDLVETGQEGAEFKLVLPLKQLSPE